MVKVTLDFDFSKYNITAEQAKNIKTKTLDLTQQDLMRNLRTEVPVDTGKLKGSWMTFGAGEDTRVILSSAKYADYLDKGTGIYGPKKKPITPKKGKVLHFYGDASIDVPGWGKASGKGEVFVKSVEGIKPHHFVRTSINNTKKKINDFAIRAIMES